MHLLYADESGAVSDPNQKHFILAGISLFERQTFWISNELEKTAARFDQAEPSSIELHGNPMFQGKKYWRKFPTETRIEAIRDCLQIFTNSHKSNRIFASVIRNEAASPFDPVSLAFEQMASRFDQYLMRLHREGDSQRGILILDKSTYEETIQNLATDFRTIGHSWGVLRNLSEVPLFLDSKASRLIQLADLVAYSFFKAYEHNDNRFLQIIESRIDSEGGIRHGLFEKI